MSMQAINFALTLPIEESGPRLLLLIIAHHVNYRTGDMFVGQGELAEEVKRDERTIRRYLTYLEDGGFIDRKEQRTHSGQRGPDRIELIGYLAWQDVIENGGVIPDPKTRGKPVQKPADKISGRDEATGQNGGVQPDKNSEPTGHTVSGTKRTTNNQLNLSAQERASVGIARAPRAVEPRQSANRPWFTVRASDDSFDGWIAHMKRLGRDDLAEAALKSGWLSARSIWAKPDSDELPNVDRDALASLGVDRMVGGE